MKKKIAILCIFLTIFISGIFVFTSKPFFYEKLIIIKNLIPSKYHETLKETLLPYLVINDQKKELFLLSKKLKKKLKKIEELKIESLTKLNFNKEQIIKINKQNFKIKYYSNENFFEFGPRSYVSSNEENIFLITGTGLLFSSSLDSLYGQNLNLTQIKTNINDFITEDILAQNSAIINDILIDQNKIFVTLVFQNNKCYENLVIKGILNYDKINFKKFFITDECNLNYSYQAGNRITKIKDNYILSIGDFDRVKNKYKTGLLVQKDEKFIGKLVLLNENKKPIIIAKGLRNSQGLFYDEDSELIFLSDHGPFGGDEINKLSAKQHSIKNFGWPLASYGDHYDNEDKELLDMYPLYKSHNNYGFEEPIYVFNPSVGPSQLIKVNDAFINNVKNSLLLSTMKDGSLYFLSFDEKYEKLINKERIHLNERIRDIDYIKQKNLIVMFLESSGSLAIINKILK